MEINNILNCLIYIPVQDFSSVPNEPRDQKISPSQKSSNNTYEIIRLSTQCKNFLLPLAKFQYFDILQESQFLITISRAVHALRDYKGQSLFRRASSSRYALN